MGKKVTAVCLLPLSHRDAVVAGVDKATISMHCYLVASRSSAMPQSRCLLKIVWPIK